MVATKLCCAGLRESCPASRTCRVHDRKWDKLGPSDAGARPSSEGLQPLVVGLQSGKALLPLGLTGLCSLLPPRVASTNGRLSCAARVGNRRYLLQEELVAWKHDKALVKSRLPPHRPSIIHPRRVRRKRAAGVLATKRAWRRRGTKPQRMSGRGRAKAKERTP
jgi:hypothetical protein